MTVSTFIKENRVLIAGFTLPLLLIGLLTISKTISKETIPAPQHTIIFMNQSWSQGRVIAEVDKSNHVTFSYKENVNPGSNTAIPQTQLFMYNPETQKLTETTLELSIKDSGPNKGKVTVKQPAELADVTVSPKTVSPDGYTFQPYYYRNQGLITDIFIGNRRHNTPVLLKNAHVIPLPAPSQGSYSYYIGNIEFIGWAIPEPASAH